jgi:hypothetical protein
MHFCLTGATQEELDFRIDELLGRAEPGEVLNVGAGTAQWVPNRLGPTLVSIITLRD